jgi:hypothetical protein
LANVATVMVREPFLRALHARPPSTEYWYPVIVLPPLEVGARSTKGESAHARREGDDGGRARYRERGRGVKVEVVE